MKQIMLLIGTKFRYFVSSCEILSTNKILQLEMTIFENSSNYRLPITDYQLPITNYQLPITNYRLPITNYRLPITDYQLPK